MSSASYNIDQFIKDVNDLLDKQEKEQKALLSQFLPLEVRSTIVLRLDGESSCNKLADNTTEHFLVFRKDPEINNKLHFSIKQENCNIVVHGFIQLIFSDDPFNVRRVIT